MLGEALRFFAADERRLTQIQASIVECISLT
jgi:hypothetical protein